MPGSAPIRSFTRSHGAPSVGRGVSSLLTLHEDGCMNPPDRGRLSV